MKRVNILGFILLVLLVILIVVAYIISNFVSVIAPAVNQPITQTATSLPVSFVISDNNGNPLTLLQDPDFTLPNIPQSNSIEVLNTSIIELENFIINLSNGWSVESGIRSTLGTDWGCYPLDLNKFCDVYTISKGDSQFFISTPAEASKEVVIDFGPLKQSLLTTSISDKLFNFSTYKTEDMNNFKQELQDSDLVFQASGCITDSICVSSGILDIDSQINKQQLDSFKEFVSSITIQE